MNPREIVSLAVSRSSGSCELARMRSLALGSAAAVLGLGCGSPQSAPATGSTGAATSATSAAAATPAPMPAKATTLALPGGGPDGVAMDYLLYNPRTNTVWVPAGNTAAVDVIDVATGKISRIEGFPTREIERRGVKRKVGPSAAALGDTGTVYVGNRGDSSVCAVDEIKLTRGTCATLDNSPDGIAYVARTHEVWVTTPRDKSIRVLDGATLAQKARIELEGGPEGFAADNTRGRFYTNLEDKDATLAIDLATHKVLATWKPACGEEGPRGLRLADAEGILLVACTGKLVSLDVAHDGAAVGSLDVGEGIDDFDYSPADHRVYVGAAKAARLTVAALDAHGGLTQIASVPTKEGARNGVVSRDGHVYLANSRDSEVVIVGP
jgi:DNA-binding beta-propeller fold protein YncE